MSRKKPRDATFLSATVAVFSAELALAFESIIAEPRAVPAPMPISARMDWGIVSSSPVTSHMKEYAATTRKNQNAIWKRASEYGFWVGRRAAVRAPRIRPVLRQR